MNDNQTPFTGFVRNGKFQPLSSNAHSGELRFTTIGMPEASSPEANELDLAEHEGTLITIEGDGERGWIYSSQVTEVAGPNTSRAVERHLAEDATAGTRGSGGAGSSGTMQSAEEALRAAREALHGESGRIQIMGRGLTPQEEARLESLRKAMGFVDQAIAALGKTNRQ